jgi:class 3 adenylate cyclase
VCFIKFGVVLGRKMISNVLLISFSTAMARSLSTLVSQLGISLRNAQLFEELQRSQIATLRFVPASFLARVGCSRASELKRGDSVQKQLAIMFADVRGFTAISESMDTGALYSFLNSVLDVVIPCISRFGGTGL